MDPDFSFGSDSDSGSSSDGSLASPSAASRLNISNSSSIGNDEADSALESDEEQEGGNGDNGSDDEEASANPSQGNSDKSSRPFFAPVEGVSFHATSFLDLHLSRPLIRACQALGYEKPTPIQAACIPLALAGRDVCASAITGSGKTAAFALPALERLLFRPKRQPAIRVLILTPTRELAEQVHSVTEKLAQFTDIRSCLVVGGLSMKVQESALRSMPDIVVATPGRIIDHLRNTMSVGLEDLAVLILDEADRLLDMGFSAEIEELIRLCPKRRQTMLFSATMTDEVDQLLKLSLNKPVRLEADPSLKRPETLTEEVVRIRRAREANQEAILLSLCLKTFQERVIIFSGTKKVAHRLKLIFGLAGLKAAELHGNLTQAQRLDAVEQFKKKEVNFLIATDIAARGLDIAGVQTVINFSCPRDVKIYLHRVGRTARAGRNGYAVTFVTEDDRSLLKSIAKKVGSQLKSRIVAEKSIAECCTLIDQMEEQITEILSEERSERLLRKAEMEYTKAENMLVHNEEIYSRPKRTWFITEKEKRLLAKAAKGSLEENNAGPNQVVSVEQAERIKQKEKRRREIEKNLPRKKRRRLEAQREMMNEKEDDEFQDKGEQKKGDRGQSLVGLGYRRAKSVKTSKKKGESSQNKPKRISGKVQSRKEEMLEMFQADMGEKKYAEKSKRSATGQKKPKHSFKSKSRYKRRK